MPGHLRIAVRALRARPGAGILAVAILTLGIGAHTAVSSAVVALVVRPLPLPESSRLVTGFALREGFDPFGTSPVEFEAFRTRRNVFQSAGLARLGTVAMQLEGAAERVQGAAVTADYLSTAGAAPVLGRTFADHDDRPGAPPVAVISHGLWQRRFGGDGRVIGAVVGVDGRTMTVIGVLPAGFDLPGGSDIWIPLQLSIQALTIRDRLSSAYWFIGRLAPGVSMEGADAAAKEVARELGRAYTQRRGWTYRIVALRQQLLGDLDGRVSRAIGVLVAAVAFLLVICCANVANLLLVNATARERDMAVRLALGASRADVFHDLLAEHFLLAGAGAAGGTLLALWIAPLLGTLNPVRASSFGAVLTDFRIDAHVLALSLAASIATAVFTGVAPALAAARRADLRSALATGAMRAGSSRAHRRRFNTLVVVEIAIAMVLLVGGGLLVRSFNALRSVDLGFSPRGLTAAQITIPSGRYASHAERAAFLERLLHGVLSIPGVVNAGITTNIPLQSPSFDSVYTVEGRAPLDSSEVPITAHRVVTSDYLQTLGVMLVRGRLLSRADGRDAPRAVIVTEGLAREAWPNQDPLGRRIRRGRVDDTQFPWMTVVGVVRDVKEDRFNFRITRAAWYVPYEQEDSSAPVTLLFRTGVDGASLAGVIRAGIRALDPEVAVSDLVAVDDHVAQVTSTERFAALLLSALAAAGVLLAALGLYGVMSYSVRDRMPEITLRIVLGARPADVVRMVVAEAGLVSGIGVAIGAVLAAAGAHAMGTLLFETAPDNAPTYLAAGATVVAASLLACYLPARVAARLEPARALR